MNTLVESTVDGRSNVRDMVNLALNNWLYAATVLVFIFFSLTAPNFLTFDNIVNLLIAASLTGLITAGFTIALLTGTIDGSITGVTAIGSVVTSVIFQRLGLPLPLAFLAVFGAAVVIGLVNSLLVIEARIFSLIATLATNGVLIGIGVLLTGGQTITITRSGLQDVFFHRFLGLPVSIWMMIVVYILGYTMLNHTKLGAHIYATGADYRAARLNGVPVNRVIRIGLIITAVTTSSAAVLATARANQSLLFGASITSINLVDVFTAVLIAGVSLFGGTGRIERNLLAVIFLATMANGLLLLRTPPALWLIIRGFFFVAAVIVDSVRR